MAIDIRHQSARQFQSTDFIEFDHIFVMDRQNYRDVIAKAINQDDIDKVELLCEFSWYGNAPCTRPILRRRNEGFEKVFDLSKNSMPMSYCKTMGGKP